MIEEKQLKKGFIIATLLSTVMGTFTTGLNLVEKVSEKRKQGKRDKGQDDQISKLQKQIVEMETKHKSKDKSEADLRQSLRKGAPSIKREYERDFERLGPRFAEGDVITQNQLQSQVIMLQGTVIALLENALQTGRIENINKLFNASEFARESSIAALQGQYQRMLQEAPLRKSGPGSTRPLPMRRISSTPSMAVKRSAKATKAPSNRSVHGSVNGNRETRAEETRVTEVATVPDMRSRKASVAGSAVGAEFDASGPLFCRYAAALQGGEQLDVCFSRGGSNSCPLCGTNMAVEEGRAWKIVKEVVHNKISTPEYDDEIIEDREYLIGNRFVIKCHRETAGFACALCYRYRDKDTLLESANGLVRHVWQRHSVEEIESDRDIRDVGGHRNSVSQRRDYGFGA